MAHIHGVFDSDAHLVIDPKTRKITNNTPEKTAIMQHDHNSERFTFEIPKEVEGHDMLKCNVVQVHYLNTDASTRAVNKGVYIVEDMQVSPEDENLLIGSWLISSNVTQLVGKLDFILRFSCVTDGNVDYAWHTDICSDFSVLKGINNGEAVVTQYADILAQWKKELEEADGTVSDAQIENALEKYFEENGTNYSSAKIGEVELTAAGWVGDASPYSQVVSIEGVTANSQVDLTPSVQQLATFYEKDLTFVTENEGGTVTVYAIGQKPTNDYTIQVTITEVEV